MTERSIDAALKSAAQSAEFGFSIWLSVRA
jgi:hypothetical protein